jgi:PncC family amidohydrolase
MPSYKKIIDTLIKKKFSISVCESFTGGQLSKVFTDISGISKIFNMGLITYSNKSKNSILGIPTSTMKKYGSVSKEVAMLMSKNLSKISKSDISISTTGIAGPTGGSKNKPVGLAYISITFLKKNYTFEKKFKGNRNRIQKDAVNFCLQELKKLI